MNYKTDLIQLNAFCEIERLLPSLYGTVEDTLSQVKKVEVMLDNLEGTEYAQVVLVVTGKMREGAMIENADGSTYIHEPTKL